jgi:hypothetical protein
LAPTYGHHGQQEQAAFVDEDQPGAQALGYAGGSRHFQIDVPHRMTSDRSEHYVDVDAS